MVPRVLLGAVNGVEIVAVGALQFTRDVLLNAVSGAANIGAEALNATVSGARGVVSATSRMVGDMAVTAQGTFHEAVYNARHSRPGATRAAALRRPAAPRAADGSGETTASVPAPARGRVRRRRAAARTARARAAA